MSKPKNENLLYGWVDTILCWLFRHVKQNEISQRIALWWGFRFRGTPKVVRLRTGQLMIVDPTDYLQCLIYYLGMFEPHCINLLEKLLKGGDTFIDIGGNIGLFSMVASSKVGAAGKVITFEPAPFHCETIRKNIRLNNFSNIDLYETALGDAPGEVELVMPKGGNQGSYSISFQSNAEHEILKAVVPVSKLDDIVQKNKISLENLSLIKMDIEGAEMLALGGMEELFKRLPSVLIEFNETALQRFGTSTRDLYTWFKDRGYAGWMIKDNGSLIAVPEGGVVFAECLFIHSKNKQHLEVIYP